MKTKNKQEIVNKSFKIDNITNANNLINQNIKKDFGNNEKNIYLFRIDVDFYNRYNFLKNERSIRTKNYTEFNSEVFIIMIKIVKNILTEKGIYKSANEIFIQTVNKRGKRKKNKRTVKKERMKELQVYLPKDENEIFFNCFYSHVLNSPEEDVNDDSFSKNYFFNDIIEYISKERDIFFKF
ncbi:hypothetical protein [Tenacibaculum finnmarkense]|uniref:hypothetical protein n=1 Tax=Tenacibaculum finnmarkense TaxID=2781243 RepID=UPI001EFB8B24|nr:hypothetical protein [Tenacibaculum finnmarkense]MCG8226363.1 hypothetical protein [Tenacibaculum finnmarkense genomovar finnmarkense]